MGNNPKCKRLSGMSLYRDRNEIREIICVLGKICEIILNLL